MENVQIIQLKIEKCPKCGKEHEYFLKATIEEKKIPLFAGPGGKSEVGLTCPTQQGTFTWMIDDPKDGEIIGVATKKEVQKYSNNKNTEFEDWVKQSRDKALAFCSTMLTTSTGAIAIYFSVQKYLGVEKIEQAQISFLTILPPILYLLAALIFIRAIQPVLVNIQPSTFEAYRKKRLENLSRYIKAGVVVFTIACLLSIGLFVYSI